MQNRMKSEFKTLATYTTDMWVTVQQWKDKQIIFLNHACIICTYNVVLSMPNCFFCFSLCFLSCCSILCSFLIGVVTAVFNTPSNLLYHHFSVINRLITDLVLMCCWTLPQRWNLELKCNCCMVKWRLVQKPIYIFYIQIWLVWAGWRFTCQRSVELHWGGFMCCQVCFKVALFFITDFNMLRAYFDFL